MQREDGWSQEDQLRRLVTHFVSRGSAFRVFNDSGIGGGVPFRSPEMMRRIWRKKARTYRSVYTAVFLNDPKLSQFLPQMQDYVAARVAEIEAGALLPGVDEDFSGRDKDGNLKYRTRERKRAQFRPALSLLMENLDLIHTVAVTDTTRLSRSEAMTWEIAQQLEEHETEFLALLESASITDSDDLGAALSNRVLAVVAEYKLREAVLGSLRGILTLLQQGKPFGKIPTWLRRDPVTGVAEFATDESGNELPQVKAVRRLIELYLHQSDYGEASLHSVSVALAREYPSPHGKVWAPATVKHILRNPALIGVQREFGVAFPIFPPLVDADTWEAIQAKLNRRGQGYDRQNLKNPEGYLMTGLLRCRCGRLMQHHRKVNGTRLYLCYATTSQRQADTAMHHASISAPEIERFMDEWMEFWSGPVIRVFKESSQGERLKGEIAELEDRLIALKQQREDDAEERRDEAIRRVRNAFGEVDLHAVPVKAMIEQGVALLQSSLLRQEQETERLLNLKQQELRAMLRGDNLAQLEHRISDWDELVTLEKNFVLRRLFQSIQVEGLPPNESLLVTLSLPDAPALPHIPMPAKRFGSGYRRRLGSARDWVWAWTEERDENGRVVVRRSHPFAPEIMEELAPWVEDEFDRYFAEG